jgi:N-acetylglucosamine transport system permease protein
MSLQLDVRGEDRAAASLTSSTAPGAPVARRLTGFGFGLLTHGFLVIWAFVVVVPLAWAIVSSFKTDKEIITSPWGLPASLRFDNFVRAWNAASIGSFFFNTVLVVIVSLTLTLLLSSLVAFVIAKFVFPGRDLLYSIFIAAMTFPAIVALIPLFFVLDNMGLSNSYTGLIGAYTAFGIPFSVFFLTAFFRTIPDEFIEAARIDGCGYWRQRARRALRKRS